MLGPLVARVRSSTSLRTAQGILAGRLGIALVAFALIGIVTLQLGLLKLNGGIGRALEHEALLQRENATLSIENSELAAGDRVELSAAAIGMDHVPPGSLRSLDVQPHSNISRAAAILRAPVTTTIPEGSTAGAEGTSSPAGEPGGSEASSSEGAAATSESAGGTGASGSNAPSESSRGEAPATSAPSSEGSSSQTSSQDSPGTAGQAEASGGAVTPEGASG